MRVELLHRPILPRFKGLRRKKLISFKSSDRSALLLSDSKKKMSRIMLVREVLSHNPGCNKLLLCTTLQVARSLVYYQSKVEVKDALLQSELKSLHEAHPWYGHRRIAWSMGICFEKARRLMKKFSIFAKVRI